MTSAVVVGVSLHVVVNKLCLCWGFVVVCTIVSLSCVFFFFFQAEDGIRDAQESRGLGDVYKRQIENVGSEGGIGVSHAVLGVVQIDSRQCSTLPLLFLSLIHI